jgi:hypothetical protein
MRRGSKLSLGLVQLGSDSSVGVARPIKRPCSRTMGLWDQVELTIPSTIDLAARRTGPGGDARSVARDYPPEIGVGFVVSDIATRVLAGHLDVLG